MLTNVRFWGGWGGGGGSSGGGGRGCRSGAGGGERGWGVGGFVWLGGGGSVSNRPFGVKHFQTIHDYSVDVTHGLALLFGIGTRAFPLWDSKTRRNNLWGGLAVRERQVQADIELTSSIVPRGTSFHRRWTSVFSCHG